MATATASMNNTGETFMFHPRTTVFEHPITYNLPPTIHSTTINNDKIDKNDFAQYYISEQIKI